MARMFRQLKFYNRDPSLKGPGIENLQMAAVPNVDASPRLPNINKQVGFKKIRQKLKM
jgi:hypothetical protein